MLNEVKRALPEERLAKVLQLAPFAAATWGLVDGLADATQAVYWSDVAPNWDGQREEEINDGIRRLLKAKRPRAAFALVNRRLEKVVPGLLYQVMLDIALGGDEQAGHYQLEPWSIHKPSSLWTRATSSPSKRWRLLSFLTSRRCRGVSDNAMRGVSRTLRYTSSPTPSYSSKPSRGPTSVRTEKRIRRSLPRIRRKTERIAHIEATNSWTHWSVFRGEML